MELFSHEYFMKQAITQAEMAMQEDEIPIGAVVVFHNKIIGKGYNQTEKLTDVTAHAEMLAITAAAQYLNQKYLEECTMYVTIEPCAMCAGAIAWSRLPILVYGAKEPKFGFSKKAESVLESKIEIITGILETDCAKIMKQFFASKR